MRKVHVPRDLLLAMIKVCHEAARTPASGALADALVRLKELGPDMLELAGHLETPLGRHGHDHDDHD